MREKKRLFIVIWASGMAGILSLLLIDLEALIAILPLAPNAEVPMSIPILKLVSLIQPAILLALAALIGVGTASKVGLTSPVAEMVASGGNIGPALRTQFYPGIIGGFAGGLCLVAIAAILRPFLTAEMLVKLGQFGSILPLPARLLYGGITEEVLLRWGLMTLLVWVPWRLMSNRQDHPRPAYFVGAILISSLLFALGHMPITFLLFPDPTPALVLFVIFGNSAFGLIAGYLYWKKGLESAMIAHAVTHVVLFTASYIGAYF